MFKTKRKRAVVLALIAFFCTAAATYVAVDWKRFGGGVLAFLKSGRNDAVARAMGGSSGSKPVQLAQGGNDHSSQASLPQLAPATSRKHPSGVGGGANGHASDEDLFKFGNPAAGGIPPGNFIVAQNDTPAGGNAGAAAFVPPVGAPAAAETGGPGVTSPAPAPAGIGAGPSVVGIGGGGKATTPAPPAATPPVASPPAGTPPAPSPPAPGPAPVASPPISAPPPSDSAPVASPPIATPPSSPAPAPIQSGTTDDPGTPPPSDSPVPPIDTPPPPVASLPPVSAVPEASPLAMLSLGALFLAVAASRKRKQA